MSQEKQLAAEAALEHIQTGMIVGLGSGSTAEIMVRKLGERVRAGLSIRGIPTSQNTLNLAILEKIPLIDFTQTTTIDLTIDGADEINADLDMIKGGGGALLREKVVASASRKVITIVDASKVVKVLGKFPLPVEVAPFGWPVVARRLSQLGAKVVLREKAGSPFVTDNHNYILDCHFQQIPKPVELEQQINQIPGVMVNGLFVGIASCMIVARGHQVHLQVRS